MSKVLYHMSQKNNFFSMFRSIIWKALNEARFDRKNLSEIQLHMKWRITLQFVLFNISIVFLNNIYNNIRTIVFLDEYEYDALIIENWKFNCMNNNFISEEIRNFYFNFISSSFKEKKFFNERNNHLYNKYCFICLKYLVYIQWCILNIHAVSGSQRRSFWISIEFKNWWNWDMV